MPLRLRKYYIVANFKKSEFFEKNVFTFNLGIFSIILFVVFSCKPTYKIETQDYASNYQTYKKTINPEYVLFNINPDTTILFSKVAVNDLLKIKPEGKTTFYVAYKLKVEIFNDSPTNSTLIDSLSYTYNDSISNKENLFSTIYLKVKAPGNFNVKLTIKDLYKDNSSTKIMELHKINGESRNDFLITDLNGFPLFKNNLAENEHFKIKCRDLSLTQLYVRYYNREFQIAQLPFVNVKEKPFDFNPDSSFFVKVNNGISDIITLKKEGIYHFQSNPKINDGITVFRFHKDFPCITTPEQMIYPLRYLTSKNEYNKIIIQQDKKMAIDEFWLNTAGNKIRGRELIKKFYNRVQDANIYFTSYMEGWKTDRGLIYIIYGNPNIVYRNAYSETWIYGEEFNNMSISFVFNKRENPFTDNDFVLTRSPVFKDSWYNAVDVWRR